jgi:hypothetical protein
LTFLDSLTSEIAAYEHVEGEVIVTQFVVLAEFLNSDGDRAIWCDTFEGQRTHQTLGLLAYGLAVENRRAADAVEDADE